jgi:aryl-alcohol dehydrogenase-like predicted oxidoreductase
MLDRREFLKIISGLAAGLHLPVFSKDVNLLQSDKFGDLLPTRALGNTGKQITMLGVGGSHIGVMSERDAQETIEAAIEGGVRFFDNAEGYDVGGSESKYGKYLTPKYREEIFLMTKTEQKSKEKALKSLEASLKRLNTDYLDLWQVHTLESVEDVDERIEGGIIDAMLEAKNSGKVKYIGFTGHATPATHSLMLKRSEEFETCQMPVNVLDPSFKSFIVHVMPELLNRKVGILAMKTLGEGLFFKELKRSEKSDSPTIKLVPEKLSIKEALYFAWSLPVSTVITGPDNAAMLKEKIELARSFKSMNYEQRQMLIVKVADIATTGLFEDYKYGEM